MGKRRDQSRDPYLRCEMHCHHDLSAGMSVSELLGSDGPHEMPRAIGRAGPPILAPRPVHRTAAGR